MIRIVRGNYVLIVENSVAAMVRSTDNRVMFTVSDPQAIEALIDCFSEDLVQPA